VVVVVMVVVVMDWKQRVIKSCRKSKQKIDINDIGIKKTNFEKEVKVRGK